MFQQYRYISARTLLGMPKLDRCQSLPQDTWTSVEKLWHLVFISHRWGSWDDPDPFGSQLAILKLLVQRIVEIADVLTDQRAGAEAVRDRVARVPSLNRQGTLQAAHLVFRTLCGGTAIAPDQDEQGIGDRILDVIGFWYDYACLPQDPKTPAEEQEFRQTLQGIGDVILSPRVSTLVLRKEGDGYLGRGWCFAESMIAAAKEDVFKPMILRTDRWDEPMSILLSGAYAAFKPEVEAMLGQWEDLANPVMTERAFESGINATALLLLLKSDGSMSEFVVTATAATGAGAGLFTRMQSRLALLPVGERLDLSDDLAKSLQGEGLECREQGDYCLVALLLLSSLTAEDARGDLAIWREGLVRFTEGLPLVVVRREGGLEWQV